ncbi:MAG: sigma-70 family RNA polymerase sigma factor, partial [Clostridia bacterium]|nr:sigma-70 family RNA polymerase sigma factor [Clostridia bacterium]
EELDECIPADMPDYESTEIGHLIDRFLESLQKLDALLFVRRYFYADSVKGIAKKTGLSENKVSKSLGRSRKELKEFLLKGGISL